MLHKLRHAMVRPGRDRLGRVEVDEAFVGSEEEGVDGRQIESTASAQQALATLQLLQRSRRRLTQKSTTSGQRGTARLWGRDALLVNERAAEV